jgi:tRNA-2-methylthio-N6-dimethylallyladenosine synthase
MNTADSERMLTLLAKKNYRLVHTAEEADLVLLNTCHIREKARHKVVSRLGVLRDLKEKKPGMTIAVAGCVAQAEGARLIKEAPVIDVLLGPGKIDELPRLLDEHAASGKTTLSIGFKKDRGHDHDEPSSARDGDQRNQSTTQETNVEAKAPQAAPLPLTGKNDISRFVNVQQGCNNYCTFCVVPFTRGREISRSIPAIVQEAEALVEAGAREITLLGQNVNSYGHDIGTDLVTLLKAVASIPGLLRLRFTTSNPHDFTPQLAELFASEPKMGAYLHLPVQSGSNEVLTRMKRKVTVEEYRERIRWLKAAVPDIAISTDLIVGFPGETEEQFTETLALVEEVGFSFGFNFKYSPRKNTPAARYQDQIPESIKESRLARLNAVQDRLTIAHNMAEVGQVREVLFHYESKKHPGHYYGRTPHFRLVRVKSGRNLIGEILSVQITEANKTALLGELV